LRLLPLVVAIAVPVFCGWLAVVTYRDRTDPEASLPARGPHATLLAPPSRAWNEAVSTHVADGLRALNDTAEEPADRLRRYREQLLAAERLLVESLRAQPAQARALAQLAAVRFELEVPMDEDAAEKHLEMIETAAEMAPHVPRVQMQIGALLLKMGRRREAEIYLGRAVALDPGLAGSVVVELEQSLYTPKEMLRVLPPLASALVALEPSFRAAGKLGEYLEALEPAMVKPTAPLLAVYADACLAAGDPARVVRRLEALGMLREPALEAEKRVQRARARLALQDPKAAVEDSRVACSILPDDARIAELHGRIALDAEDPKEAAGAFRRALGLLARGSGDGRVRARLYREIGEAEEKLGSPARAYDAYRRAVELDASEPIAKRRISQMRKAAGFATTVP
jgi:tetratricopeptide (TPR) repeat protein